ncbi:MAG TPA: beta-ketoacyl synthase N-terminal-like domain-containing protein [Thermoanaerobaculia bacterium]|nr:beta-ketoacyl synthase N-terminal-like domain-containing protein [Thermoanaerobaculia bacterium]
MTRVAITGIGTIAPGAIGIGAFREMLDSGRSAFRVLDFVPKQLIAPMKLRRMNTLSRFAVAAAKLAIDDRGAALPDGTGIAMGTAFGPVQTSVDYMQEYVEKGAALAPPQLFAESVANAPGSHVGIEFGLRGFNVTLTQRESSALAALMYAATQVAKGSVPAAIAGGVEEVSEITFSVLDRIGALGRCCRPFDRTRDGMVFGEGGAALILEPNAGDAYAFVAGFGIARDRTATISDWGDGVDDVVRAMRAAIDDAGLAIDDIGAIYASANSSVRGDRLESRAIQTLFRDVPPVVATKGYFGEYAAGGALQIIAAALAIADQKLHASIGFSEGEEEMRFAPVRESRPCKLRHVLVNSLSAGGGVVSAVLSA